MVKRIPRLSRRKRAIDERLLLAYLVTIATGLVVVYSTSSMIAESRLGSHLFFFRQQLLWVVLSLAAVALICRLDLNRFAVYSAPTYLFVLGLLAMVFLMPARNGSHRWLMIGPLNVQPSELLKVVMVYYLAFSLSNRARNIGEARQLLLRYAPLIGCGLVLVLLEPDLGTTIVIAATAVGVFFLAGARVKHLMIATVPLGALAAAVVFLFGYKKDRVMDYLAAVVDPLQGSYQAKQAALTLGAGGLLGTGLGDGRQKLFFLPYPHTDFIFASLGEEVGLVGLLLVLFLMFYMLMRGFKIASGQPDKFGFLLASGVVLSLFVNMAVNVGVVTCLLPVTGLPLPFLSYGGSSLLVSSAAIGILLNLSRKVAR